MQAWEVKFNELVSDAADTWHSEANRLSMGGMLPPFYIYYRESTPSQDGALYLVPAGIREPDPSWYLGAAEPIRANLTRDQARRRIYYVARSLPILKPTD